MLDFEFGIWISYETNCFTFITRVERISNIKIIILFVCLSFSRVYTLKISLPKSYTLYYKSNYLAYIWIYYSYNSYTQVEIYIYNQPYLGIIIR